MRETEKIRMKYLPLFNDVYGIFVVVYLRSLGFVVFSPAKSDFIVFWLCPSMLPAIK